MIDCKGKKLSVGDFVKYRSIHSELTARTPKIYVARVLKLVNNDDDDNFQIVSSNDRFDYLMKINLSLENMRRGAIEKIPPKKAMLWMLENL